MMKKIYTEKIHQSTRFGLIDEDGRKTPCGTLWSDAQRETFERLMNGGNNLAFMAWDSNGGKKSALWAKWTSIANGDFDDYQIKEFAYQLCWAALASSDTSEYVKDEIRKIVRLANCSNTAKEWGRVQEYRNKKYVTAKEV